MSVNASSADEGDDDDDFGDAISMVHGLPPGSSTKRRHIVPGMYFHHTLAAVKDTYRGGRLLGGCPFSEVRRGDLEKCSLLGGFFFVHKVL